MSISPFFRTLRSAYQAEIDDLATDSEGKNVLKQRLSERRKELDFLLQMLELSPEMVSVVFHQAFKFKLPGALDHLVSHESEDLPEWDTIADTITVAPWAQDLLKLILQQPRGEWFMSVAAGLEYLYDKMDKHASADADHDEASDHDNPDGSPTDHRREFNADDDRHETDEEARNREDAGADWMAAQGFDRKD